MVQHPALDAATEGFKAALEEKLGDEVYVEVQVASGELNQCTPIVSTYVSNQYNLIMANYFSKKRRESHDYKEL